jgi:hypothetical protein
MTYLRPTFTHQSVYYQQLHTVVVKISSSIITARRHRCTKLLRVRDQFDLET